MIKNMVETVKNLKGKNSFEMVIHDPITGKSGRILVNQKDKTFRLILKDGGITPEMGYSSPQNLMRAAIKSGIHAVKGDFMIDQVHKKGAN